MLPQALRSPCRLALVRAADNSIIRTSTILRSRSFILTESQRETSTFLSRHVWPEPITQQTLQEFLDEINYFEDPKCFMNIGLDKSKLPQPPTTENAEEIKLEKQPHNVDEVLGLLGKEVTAPDLNIDDAIIEGDALARLALTSGIYRDLFNSYTPNRDHISFTEEQAHRLDKLTPKYWFTEMPFGRVKRNRPKQTPLTYFDPVVEISARFIHRPSDTQTSDELFAHNSYYGNIIPANEAQMKPSIMLNGKILSGLSMDDSLTESSFDNWTPGQISTVNFGNPENKLYSLALINLDHLHKNASNLHWMVANIKPSSKSQNSPVQSYEEVCEYLPVHGIQGFGYSRYVFLVFQHDTEIKPSKISDFSLESRKFSASDFINEHKSSGLVPVGLSWFQSTWDISSNAIFHDYLKQKAPVYEYIQMEDEKKEEKMYPGVVAFNSYIDRFRSKKSINEQVLLERLKNVDPFNYKDQYIPPRVPPTVFTEEVDNSPSWMRNVLFKRDMKLGYWRGLRPASAILPLNNNADLDHPVRPIGSSYKSPPGAPNQHEWVKRKIRRKKPEPENEMTNVHILDDHEIHLDEVKKIMSDFESTAKTKKSQKQQKQ